MKKNKKFKFDYNNNFDDEKIDEGDSIKNKDYFDNKEINENDFIKNKEEYEKEKINESDSIKNEEDFKQGKYHEGNIIKNTEDFKKDKINENKFNVDTENKKFNSKKKLTDLIKNKLSLDNESYLSKKDKVLKTSFLYNNNSVLSKNKDILFLKNNNSNLSNNNEKNYIKNINNSLLLKNKEKNTKINLEISQKKKEKKKISEKNILSIQDSQISEMKKSRVEEISNSKWKIPSKNIIQKNSREIIISNLSRKIEEENHNKDKRNFFPLISLPTINLDISFCDTKRSKDIKSARENFDNNILNNFDFKKKDDLEFFDNKAYEKKNKISCKFQNEELEQKLNLIKNFGVPEDFREIKNNENKEFKKKNIINDFKIIEDKKTFGEKILKKMNIKIIEGKEFEKKGIKKNECKNFGKKDFLKNYNRTIEDDEKFLDLKSNEKEFIKEIKFENNDDEFKDKEDEVVDNNIRINEIIEKIKQKNLIEDKKEKEVIKLIVEKNKVQKESKEEIKIKEKEKGKNDKSEEKQITIKKIPEKKKIKIIKQKPKKIKKEKENILKNTQKTPKELLTTKKTDEIMEHVLDNLINNFFEDNLYKFFFLPEKIKGIKTGYNYIKLYLQSLKKKIESKIKRKL